MPLEWVEAKREHRGLLRAFICTDPAKARWDRVRKRSDHPRPWELEVQSAVREKIKPPKQHPEHLYLGFDGKKLAVVVYFFHNEKQDVVLVQVVARAQWAKARGVGANAMDMVDRLTDEVAPGVRLAGRIHKSNDRSKRMCADAGWEHVDDEGPMEVWLKVKGSLSSEEGQVPDSAEPGAWAV